MATVHLQSLHLCMLYILNLKHSELYFWFSQPCSSNLPISLFHIPFNGITTAPHPFWGEGNSNPLLYSFLENPVDRGAWRVAVHRVTQSWKWLKRLRMHACIGEGNGNPLQYSCLENLRGSGAWWADIYGVAQSQTGLKWLSSSSSNPLFNYPSAQGKILRIA